MSTRPDVAPVKDVVMDESPLSAATGLLSGPRSAIPGAVGEGDDGEPASATSAHAPDLALDRTGTLVGIEGLVVGIEDQLDVERSVGLRLMEDIKKKEDELDEKRLEKTREAVKRAKLEMHTLKYDLETKPLKPSQKASTAEKVKKAESKLANLKHEEAQIRDRVRKREDEHQRKVRYEEHQLKRKRSGTSGRDGASTGAEAAASLKSLKSTEETEREWLIRTGKITPFDAVQGLSKSAVGAGGPARPVVSSGNDASRRVGDLTAENQRKEKVEEELKRKRARKGKGPGVAKRRRILDSDGEEEGTVGAEASCGSAGSDGEYREAGEALTAEEDDAVEVVDDSEDEASALHVRPAKREQKHDDGDEMWYQKRVRVWLKERRLKRLATVLAKGADNNEDDEEDESLYAEPEREPLEPSPLDVYLEGGYVIPGDIHSRLFDYQKTCVRWLWELYCQKVGGIVGDEMGLGKTVQVIAFLAGLHRSGMLDRPVLVVCPATVLKQWCNEFHAWWPAFRVCILHSSGSGMGGSGNLGEGRYRDDDDTEEAEFTEDEDEEEKPAKKRRKGGDEDDYVEVEDRRGISKGGGRGGSGSGRGGKKATKTARPPPKQSAKVLKQVASIVDRVVAKGHVIITTYEGVRVHKKALIPVRWGYCVLDEGHKIRNADASITLACKMVKTPHRIILSGTPIQNNLKELWSLYDFAYPGRLGTLPVFVSQFEIPIRLGAYSNATNLQVQTAHRCAQVLRDLISPYLLRRMKSDVASDLPKKTEQVLFCRLSSTQRDLYERFLDSRDCRQILEGRKNALAGIDTLRKICNHPDLVYRLEDQHKPDYGDLARSGKLQVVRALLASWSKQGHRTLVFCQTRQMQDILERMVRDEGWRYFRMDGNTQIRNRIGMVDEFNADKSIPVFILTTKVGGLGINLTGANRVIIFDPDWNPSTDVQARERAWRLGQTRDVHVYRLMMSGTIEEKIYHRQIYKQFLTDKILQDASSGNAPQGGRRFFDSGRLFDLFKLGDAAGTGTETGSMFRGTEKVLEKGRANDEAGPAAGAVPEERKVERALEEVDGLVKVEEYRDEDSERRRKRAEAADDGQAHTEEEERLLSMLVHTRVAHDDIMRAGTSAGADDEATRIAERVAEEASREIRRSRVMVKKEQKRAAEREGGDYAGVVTWTGHHGEGGASGGRRREDSATLRRESAQGSVASPVVAAAGAGSSAGAPSSSSSPTVVPPPGSFANGRAAVPAPRIANNVIGAGPSSAGLLAMIRKKQTGA